VQYIGVVSTLVWMVWSRLLRNFIQVFDSPPDAGQAEGYLLTPTLG
jgi:hypothetical protein